MHLLELMFDEGSVGFGEERNPISISSSANCLLFFLIIYSNTKSTNVLAMEVHN